MHINKSKVATIKVLIEEYIKNKRVTKDIDNLDEMSWHSQVDSIFENGLVTYSQLDIEELSFLQQTVVINKDKKEIEVKFWRGTSILAVITIPYSETDKEDIIELHEGIVISVN